MHHENAHGILVIDKPEGITSHDVVNRVRRIFGTRRVGHTGTLDPFATGVMVVVVGRATRLAQFLDANEKEYEAVIRFGFETDTGDRTGTQRPGTLSDDLSSLRSVDWEDVLQEFLGEIQQLPPMYSAKKIDGKKLYEHARKGFDVERSPIKVVIRKIEMIDIPDLRDGDPVVRIAVVCSAGTYIRTLAEDVGRKIGIGAHLDQLRRTRSGRFALNHAVGLDVLGESSDPSTFLLAMDDALEYLPGLVLSDDRVEKTRSGLATRLPDGRLTEGMIVRMTDERGRLIAVGIYDAVETSVRPKVVLI